MPDTAADHDDKPTEGDSDGCSDPVGKQSLYLQGDVLLHGILPVGQVEGDMLVLNLGWCRMAGLSVRVEGDPQRDRQRGGIVLDRQVRDGVVVDG